MDEVNNKRKKFICQQHILLQRMGYFRFFSHLHISLKIALAYVTPREAALNDALEGVDISVHCDVSIFAWLMDYIRSEENVGKLGFLLFCIHDFRNVSIWMKKM